MDRIAVAHLTAKGSKGVCLIVLETLQADYNGEEIGTHVRAALEGDAIPRRLERSPTT